MKKIHVVGSSPRSGTTLIAEALRVCFEIDGYCAHERSLLKKQQEDVAIRLTKKPDEILLVEPFLRIDPDMHVIATIRDPRDVVVSRHGKAPDHFWTGLGQWNHCEQAVRSLMRFDRFRLVRYEDLVTDPDSVQKSIAEWLPWLRQTAPFSEYHQRASVSEASNHALRGVRPIAPKSVGRWRDNLGRVVQQIQRHGPITPALMRWGYEEDAGWETILEGVEPDMTAQFKREFIDRRRKRRYFTRYCRATAIAAGRRCRSRAAQLNPFR